MPHMVERGEKVPQQTIQEQQEEGEGMKTSYPAQAYARGELQQISLQTPQKGSLYSKKLDFASPLRRALFPACRPCVCTSLLISFHNTSIIT